MASDGAPNQAAEAARRGEMAEILRGVGVSPGIAIGPVFVLDAAAQSRRSAGPPQEEQQAYERAVEESTAQLEHLAKHLRAQGLGEQAGIMDAQAVMLHDPGWMDMITTQISEGTPADEAVRTSAEHFAGMFEAMDDPYLAARAADVRDAAGRLAASVTGESIAPQLPGPCIVVAHELTPSQTAGLDRALVLGFATDTGSVTSHTAILARALDIPAVVGLSVLSTRVEAGQEIALDGEAGTVEIEPSAQQRQRYREQQESLRRRRARLSASSDLPAETRDGHRLVLAANIGSPEDVGSAVEAGAEGVGLFRTEFLFAGRSTMPSEEEQVEAYRSVLGAMPEHRIVIRTLDVGGDKPLPYLPQAREDNPFLGLRGIRYTLAYPELLRIQLRALLRASPAGRLAVMFPMVSELGQIRAGAALLADAQRDVGGEAELGIMVEVPAAALLAAQFAPHLSFLSAGTNDLTQYTLAIDRGNEAVASLYRPLQPAILRLLTQTAHGAHKHGRWVGICGEMAGDLTAIPILIGLGFDELSMTPNRIPEARERIRSVTREDCRVLASRALKCDTADEVEELVARAIR